MNDTSLSYDEDTKHYFNTFKPTYSPKRVEAFLEFYLKHNIKNVLDIGSGDGEAVTVLYRRDESIRYTLSDISDEYLPAHKLFEKKIGSILDKNFAHQLRGKYDAIQCVALLHHLVENSREKSIDNVRVCLQNMREAAGSKGYVVIFEPTWEPQWLMSVAFYVKLMTSKFVKRRLDLKKGSILNFGLPVVSYLSDGVLRKLFDECNLQLVEAAVFSEQTHFGLLNSRRMQYFLKSR